MDNLKDLNIGFMKENDNPLKFKTMIFAIRVVNLNKYLCNEKKEYILSKQLLRSSTAIGALVREAEQGQSKADFIHKLSISLKECNETLYWLELLYRTDYLLEKEYNSLNKDAEELLKILVSSIKTAKKNAIARNPLLIFYFIIHSSLSIIHS